MGYDGGYSTVKSYVKKVKRTTRRIPAEIRFETIPGIQMQADWGELEYVIVDGIKKKLYCFNAVLGYSRMRYVEFTLDCKTETFIQCHPCYAGKLFSPHSISPRAKVGLSGSLSILWSHGTPVPRLNIPVFAIFEKARHFQTIRRYGWVLLRRYT